MKLKTKYHPNLGANRSDKFEVQKVKKKVFFLKIMFHLVAHPLPSSLHLPGNDYHKSRQFSSMNKKSFI